MSTPRPPQGWEMTVGTWNTDAQRAETPVNSGAYSLEQLGVSGSTTLTSPYIPVEDNADFWVGALVQATSTSTTVTLELFEYDRDRATSGHDALVFENTLDAADTWQWIGKKYTPTSSGIRFIRVNIQRDSAGGGSVYWDRVLMERIQPSWTVALDSGGAQAITTGTWTTVLFTSAANDAHTNTMTVRQASLSAGVITVGPPGAYNLSGSVELAALSDGTEADVRIKVTQKGGGGTPVFRYGSKVTAGGADTLRLPVAVANEHCWAGDTVELQVWHNEGSNINVTDGDADDSFTFFSGARIGKM